MEELHIFVIVVTALCAITIIYKLVPYRELTRKRPRLAIFPKYRTVLILDDQGPELLSARLHEMGYRVASETEETATYVRGSLLGDLSSRLAKTKITIEKTSSSRCEAKIEGGWMVAFDTGDLWHILSQLEN